MFHIKDAENGVGSLSREFFANKISGSLDDILNFFIHIIVGFP